MQAMSIGDMENLQTTLTHVKRLPTAEYSCEISLL